MGLVTLSSATSTHGTSYVLSRASLDTYNLIRTRLSLRTYNPIHRIQFWLVSNWSIEEWYNGSWESLLSLSLNDQIYRTFPMGLPIIYGARGHRNCDSDGEILVVLSATQKTLYFYDLENKTLLRTIRDDDLVDGVTVAYSDGRADVILAGNGQLKIRSYAPYGYVDSNVNNNHKLGTSISLVQHGVGTKIDFSNANIMLTGITTPETSCNPSLDRQYITRTSIFIERQNITKTKVSLASIYVGTKINLYDAVITQHCQASALGNKLVIMYSGTRQDAYGTFYQMNILLVDRITGEAITNKILNTIRDYNKFHYTWEPSASYPNGICTRKYFDIKLCRIYGEEKLIICRFHLINDTTPYHNFGYTVEEWSLDLEDKYEVLNYTGNYHYFPEGVIAKARGPEDPWSVWSGLTKKGEVLYHLYKSDSYPPAHRLVLYQRNRTDTTWEQCSSKIFYRDPVFLAWVGLKNKYEWLSTAIRNLNLEWSSVGSNMLLTIANSSIAKTKVELSPYDTTIIAGKLNIAVQNWVKSKWQFYSEKVGSILNLVTNAETLVDVLLAYKIIGNVLRVYRLPEGHYKDLTANYMWCYSPKPWFQDKYICGFVYNNNLEVTEFVKYNWATGELVSSLVMEDKYGSVASNIKSKPQIVYWRGSYWTINIPNIFGNSKDHGLIEIQEDLSSYLLWSMETLIGSDWDAIRSIYPIDDYLYMIVEKNGGLWLVKIDSLFEITILAQLTEADVTNESFLDIQITGATNDLIVLGQVAGAKGIEYVDGPVHRLAEYRVWVLDHLGNYLWSNNRLGPTNCAYNGKSPIIQIAGHWLVDRTTAQPHQINLFDKYGNLIETVDTALMDGEVFPPDDIVFVQLDNRVGTNAMLARTLNNLDVNEPDTNNSNYYGNIQML